MFRAKGVVKPEAISPQCRQSPPPPNPAFRMGRPVLGTVLRNNVGIYLGRYFLPVGIDLPSCDPTRSYFGTRVSHLLLLIGRVYL